MPAEISMAERIARQLYEDERALALKLAEIDSPRYGSKKISPEQELELWEYVDPEIDVDALRIEGLTDRTLGLLKAAGVDVDRFDMKTYERLRQTGTPDETWIAALRYPNRVRLMQSAGRALSQDAQVTYVQRMNKRAADRAAEQQQEPMAMAQESAQPPAAPQTGGF